ncbi:MAG: lytic murein transglycosylase [Aeromicrobium sp.]
MSEQRRGFGIGEVLLVAIALCAMIAIGIAAASAFTQTPPAEPDLVATPVPTATTPLQPVVPSAEPQAPVGNGSQVSTEWVRDIAARTGIGEIALQAYGSATLRLGKEQPSCRLGWTTLAGIGGIESLHGTDGGAYLLPDGQTSQPILGPALDGTGGNAAIKATAESTQWHGDAQWDHAVGPMQFIPSTWERWESDGNDDDVADPSNVFDAAYAAGRYLCASGADLRTGEGWTRAIFSYNHSDDYVRSVLAYANFYAAA